MLASILGISTIIAIVITTGVTVAALFITGKEQRVWMRRLRVPRPIKAPLELSSGSEFVGWV